MQKQIDMKNEEMFAEYNQEQWVARQEELMSGDVMLVGSKKEVIERAQQWAEEIADKEARSERLFKRFSSIQRIKEYIDTVQKIFREQMVKEMNDKELAAYGMKFTLREGAKAIDYVQDDIIQSLEEQIKERKELLKVAHNSKQPIYDADGVEVPKLPLKKTSSSIMIKY